MFNDNERIDYEPEDLDDYDHGILDFDYDDFIDELESIEAMEAEEND